MRERINTYQKHKHETKYDVKRCTLEKNFELQFNLNHKC